MVEGKNDYAVTYVNSETGFDSLRIVKGVDRLIYQQYQHKERTSITFYQTYNLRSNLSTETY